MDDYDEDFDDDDDGDDDDDLLDDEFTAAPSVAALVVGAEIYFPIFCAVVSP